MRKLIVFNSVSLDGYFTDAAGDMSWAHKPPDDAEWNAFTAGNASGGGALVFGRVTYDMMAGFWPTPQAAAMMPVVAERMNALPKFVFSKTMKAASWNNSRLLSGDLATEMHSLKKSPGEDLAILGSGRLIAQLADLGLIDQYQLVVNPIALGAGRTMFAGLKHRLILKRVSSRTFANGNVVLCYEPMT